MTHLWVEKDDNTLSILGQIRNLHIIPLFILKRDIRQLVPNFQDLGRRIRFSRFRSFLLFLLFGLFLFVLFIVFGLFLGFLFLCYGFFLLSIGFGGRLGFFRLRVGFRGRNRSLGRQCPVLFSRIRRKRDG